MPYISNTERDRQKILKTIGVNKFEDLLTAIPEELRMKKPLTLSEPLSELEINKNIQAKKGKNISCEKVNSFLGGGIYDHFIPSAIETIVSRPEFLTAYTPYQAEVSQGTLQYIFEYQTLICELTGMEIANAGMYDGASSIAEAILMAVRKNHLTKAILPATLNPNYVQVIKAYTEGNGIELLFAPEKDGVTDLSALASMLNDTIGSVVIQTPNFYGNIEDAKAIESIVHKNPKCLLIACVDPVSLAIFMPPAEYNADIAVGEGQALGNNMFFGGPLFGFFATKLDMARLMPGRIVGGTIDKDGKKAYVLTLQAREQHIRRAKATSNICSNESLCTLAAVVYLCLLGKEGLVEIATQSAQKAHYTANELCKIPGLALAYPKTYFFKEFVLKTPKKAEEIIKALLPKKFYAGIDLAPYGKPDELMIAVTEKKTKAEIDSFVQAMREVVK
mgnify:FL=1